MDDPLADAHDLDLDLDLDLITIRDMRLHASVGPDRWGKPRAQPVSLSLWLGGAAQFLARAGRSDDLAHTLNYGAVYKAVRGALDAHESAFASLSALALKAVNTVLATAMPEPTSELLPFARVVARAHNQFLRADGLEVDVRTGTRTGNSDAAAGGDVWWKIAHTIRNVRLHALIGVNPPERAAKQPVVVSVTLHSAAPEVDWLGSYERVCEVRSSGFCGRKPVHINA
jgi:dihydroneopterin aldolase